MSVSEGIIEERLVCKAVNLLEQKGIDTNNISIKSCSPGGNNRVSVIENSKHKYLLKNYYTSKTDTRNRLQREWDFLIYAEEMGIGCVPKPIACDHENKIGIYEFIEGDKLSEEDVNQNHVQEAINFVQLLNNPNRGK